MQLRVHMDEAEEQPDQHQREGVGEAQPSRDQRHDDGEDEEQDDFLDVGDGDERVRGKLLPLTRMSCCLGG